MELNNVTFEQANKLKVLGFPQDYDSIYVVRDCYSEDGNYGTPHKVGELIHNPYGFSQDDWIEAPTLELVNKWLRDEKKFYIAVHLDSWAYESRCGYYLVIHKIDENFDEVSPIEPVFFKTYEEALSTGIDYVVELLENILNGTKES